MDDEARVDALVVGFDGTVWVLPFALEMFASAERLRFVIPTVLAGTPLAGATSWSAPRFERLQLWIFH